MIQDKIEQAKITEREAIVGSSEEQVYGFKESDLLSLLREVAEEQREICADNVFWESGKETDPQYMRESIIDAPYPEPLNEADHE